MSRKPPLPDMPPSRDAGGPRRIKYQRANDFFISYARKDATIAQSIQLVLQSEGFRVWRDDSLRAGEHFPSALEQAIANSAFVLCLWSRSSIASEWVLREAGVARIQSRLLPIRLDDCTIPADFAEYHTITYVDLPDTLNQIYKATCVETPWQPLIQQHTMHHIRDPLRHKYPESDEIA